MKMYQNMIGYRYDYNYENDIVGYYYKTRLFMDNVLVGHVVTKTLINYLNKMYENNKDYVCFCPDDVDMDVWYQHNS